MKKSLLAKAVLSLSAVVLMQEYAAAQQPLHSDTVLRNLVPVRFMVNSPAAVSGIKTVTYAPWSKRITTPIVNTGVIKGLDTLGAAALTNAAALSGKIALLYRGGGVNFTDKALRAQTAGAVGLIIVNNIPGEPVGMGGTPSSTVNIPVVMVSDVVGAAITQQLRNSVAVNATIGNWSLGLSHDLSVIDGFASMPNALNIPEFLWSNSQNVLPYKNYAGAAVGNFGTSGTETNITVKDSIVWNPLSGSPSLAQSNTYSIASIVKDSIKFGFGTNANSYYLTPAGKGRYDYYTKLSYANTDGAPDDNINMFSQYINDSVYCKSRYNYTRNEPMVTISIQPLGSTDPFNMGPMLFTTRKAAINSMKFYLATNDPNLDGKVASSLVFKWIDGANGGDIDSLIEGIEIETVGFASRGFGAGDTSSYYTMIPFDANDGKDGVPLDSNAWYWTSIQAPGGTFLGVDENISYYTRVFAQRQFGISDYPEGAFFGGFGDIQGVQGAAVITFPFGGANNGQLDILNTLYDRYNQTPAVALNMARTRVATAVNTVKANIGSVSIYPNPSTAGYFTVDLNLNKASNRVTYRLVDGLGRMVSEVVHTNVQNEKFQYTTTGLAAGNYYLIVNDGGQGTLGSKIVIR